MDNSTNDLEILVKYLDGELSPDEQQSVELRLNADANFLSELEGLRLARQAIRDEAIRKQVSHVHSGYLKTAQAPIVPLKKRKPFRYALSVAAAAIIIFAAVFLYALLTISSEKLFSQHYRHYELSTLRSDDTASRSAMIVSYKSGNYGQVIQIARNLSSLTSSENMLLGISYLEMDKTDSAIQQLSLAARNNSDGNLISQTSEYYLGLAYLRAENYQQALRLLEMIREDQTHLYHPEVTGSLIRKIKILRWKK